MVYNENKYRKWVFTINELDGDTLPLYTQLIEVLDSLSVNYVFQLEKANRLHYQGYLETELRQRQSTLLNKFVNTFIDKNINVRLQAITIDRMMGSTEEAINYVKKAETRVEGPFYSKSLLPYQGKDVSILNISDNLHEWQTDILHEIFNLTSASFREADDRTVNWITDSRGGSGKSKFVKYLSFKYPNDVIKLPFGSASQLRASVIAAGKRKVYFIDIPRTLGRDDDTLAIISAVEDIKNGFVSSSMYGKYQTLMFEPPHIYIFSNDSCPLSTMSRDRWVVREMTNKPYRFILYDHTNRPIFKPKTNND